MIRNPKTRRSKLKQCYPFPDFEIIGETVNEWRVSIRDNTDSFESPVHFTCPLSKWNIEDIVKAGGRECANGEGIITVSAIVRGTCSVWGIFVVRYALGSWQINRLKGGSIEGF